LFKALMELRRFSQRADNLSLRFVGRTEPQYLAAVQQSGLEDAVKFDSPVDHRTAVSMMKGADGLLLITRGDKCELPGKLFEYLGSGRPILALAPADGEAARVVQETGAGIVVDPFDVGCIREALTQFLEWMHNRPAPPPGSLEPFTREYATRRLVAVLEQVLVPHPTRST
jgi:glycosyltransferase involved in cell wall biosynthesis